MKGFRNPVAFGMSFGAEFLDFGMILAAFLDSLCSLRRQDQKVLKMVPWVHFFGGGVPSAISYSLSISLFRRILLLDCLSISIIKILIWS